MGKEKSKKYLFKRFKALFIDYLIILLYLILLFGLFMGIYYLIFSRVPNLNHTQSQLIAFCTTVLPTIIFFSFLEARAPNGSIGKRRVGLKVVYMTSPIIGSIIRNVIEILPGQIAHLAVIEGIYYGFESIYSLYYINCIVSFIYPNGNI